MVSVYGWRLSSTFCHFHTLHPHRDTAVSSGNTEGQSGEIEMSGATRFSVLATVAVQGCSKEASMVQYE